MAIHTGHKYVCEWVGWCQENIPHECVNGLNRRSHPVQEPRSESTGCASNTNPSRPDHPHHSGRSGRSQQDAQAAPTTQHRWRSGSGRARMLVIGKGVELMMRARATTRCTGLTIQIVRRESHVSSSFDSWRLSWPWVGGHGNAQG